MPDPEGIPISPDITLERVDYFEYPLAEAAFQIFRALLRIYLLFVIVIFLGCMLLFGPIILIALGVKFLVDNTYIYALATFVYLKGDLHELR